MAQKLLKDIVAKLCDKNPELEKNVIYLLLECWDYQGLKLYPVQRDLILSGKLYTPDGVSRELRRWKKAKPPKRVRKL